MTKITGPDGDARFGATDQLRRDMQARISQQRKEIRRLQIIEEVHWRSVTRHREEKAASDARIEAAVRAGLEAAAKWIDKNAEAYVAEHVVYHYAKRRVEFPAEASGWLDEQAKTAKAIRAIAADPDAVARIAKEVAP